MNISSISGEVKVKLGGEGLDVNVLANSSKLKVTLTQQQIRMLLKIIEDVSWCRSDRPRESPLLVDTPLPKSAFTEADFID